MPVFEYTGVNQKGKKINGTVDAESDRAARLKLRRQGIFPMSIGVEGSSSTKVGLNSNIDLGKYFKRIKIKDVAIMTRQLATLVSANIPLVDALTALVDQVDNPKLRSIVAQVKDKVTEGSKLSDAFRPNVKIFGEMFINMINAGESSGTLSMVLLRLADFTEGQSQLRSKIIGAMVYPAIMACVGIVLIVGLLTFVVPKIAQIFEGTKVALPLPTKILLVVSNTFANYWYILLILVPIIVYLVRKQLKTPKGREWWDKKSLKLPLFGKLNRMVIVARFTRTLATLLTSGIPLLTAMGIVKNVVTNSVLRKVLEETQESVREGQNLAETLRKSGQFPSIVTHMISIGEKTGELGPMLVKVADSYDVQVNNTVTALTSILEPIMILFMAGIVGSVVLAIMLPIMQMNQLAG